MPYRESNTSLGKGTRGNPVGFGSTPLLPRCKNGSAQCFSLGSQKGSGRTVRGTVGWIVPQRTSRDNSTGALFNEVRVGGAMADALGREVSKPPASGTWQCSLAFPARLPSLAWASQGLSRSLCPWPYQGSRAYSSMAPASGLEQSVVRASHSPPRERPQARGASYAGQGNNWFPLLT